MRKKADALVVIPGAPIMTLAEIWPTLKCLSPEEKRALLEALSEEIAQEEATTLIDPNRSYEVWSPFEAHEAAVALQRFLDGSGPSE